MWHSSEGQIKNISQPSYLKCSACSLGYQENWTPTWIVVFRNGDKYHNGTRFLVSPAHQRNFDNLLESLTKRLEPSFGAVRQVYSPLSGTSVKCLRDLKPNHKYVVAGKERLQKISSGYLTLEEKFQKKLICKHKARNMLYYNEDYKLNKSFNDDYSNIPARYFVDAERLRKGMMTIFVHRNGDFDNRPIRFVLSEKDRSNLLWWGPTTRTIAQRLKSGSIRSFHTVDGEEVHTPCDLQNGQAYVVVGRMEKFVRVPYKSPDVVSFVCCQESEHIRHLDESMPEYCISHQIYTSESSGKDLNDNTMKTSSRATDQKEGTEYNKRWRESLNEEQNPNPKSYGCVYIPNLSQKHKEARKEEPRIINKKHSIKETKIIKEERKPQYDIKRNNYVPGVIENKQKTSQFEVKQNEERENNESSRIQKIQPQGYSQVNKIIETKEEEKSTQVEENKKESEAIDVKNEKEPKIEEKNKELKKTATKKCFNFPCIDGQKSSHCDEQNKEDETDSKDIITQVEEEIQPCKSNDREGSNKGIDEEIEWIKEEKTQSSKTKRCFSCPCFYRDEDTNKEDGSKDTGPQISEKNIESTESDIREDEKEMKNGNKNEGFEKNTKDNEKPKRKKCCNCLCIRGKKSSRSENEHTMNCKNKKSSVEKQQQFEEKTKSEPICIGSEERNQEPKTNGSLKTETRDKANQTDIDGEYYLTSMKSCPKRSPNQPVSWNEFPQEKVHVRKTKDSDKVLIIYKQRGKLNTAPKKSFHSKRHGKRIVRGLHKNNHPRPLWTNRFKKSKKKHLRPLWRNCIKKPQLKRIESEKAELQGPRSNYWVTNMRTKRRHKRCKNHNKSSEMCHHYHSEPYYVGYLNTHDTGRHDLKFQCSGSSESPIVMGDVLLFDEDPGDERLVAVYEANTLIEPVNQNGTPNDTAQLITRNEIQILQKPHDKLCSESLSNNNETNGTHSYDAENSKSSKIQKFVICKAYKYDIMNEGSDASTKHDNVSKEDNNKKGLYKSPEIACPILFDQNPQKQTEINEKADGLRKNIKNSNMRGDSDLESICSDATFTMNLSNFMKDGKWEGEHVVQGKINQGSTNADYPSNKSELKLKRNDQADKTSDIIHSQQKYSRNKTVGKVEREKKTNPEIKMTPEDLALEQEYLKEEFEEYSGD